jgi:hypothetical protein
MFGGCRRYRIERSRQAVRSALATKLGSALSVNRVTTQLGSARGEPANADKLRYEMYRVFSGPWPWPYGRTLTHGHIAA